MYSNRLTPASALTSPEFAILDILRVAANQPSAVAPMNDLRAFIAAIDPALLEIVPPGGLECAEFATIASAFADVIAWVQAHSAAERNAVLDLLSHIVRSPIYGDSERQISRLFQAYTMNMVARP